MQDQDTFAGIDSGTERAGGDDGWWHTPPKPNIRPGHALVLQLHIEGGKAGEMAAVVAAPGLRLVAASPAPPGEHEVRRRGRAPHQPPQQAADLGHRQRVIAPTVAYTTIALRIPNTGNCTGEGVLALCRGVLSSLVVRDGRWGK